MMEPKRIFLFLSLIAIAIAGLAFVFPAKGIKITDSLVLKFNGNLQSIINRDTVAYADISAIISENEDPELTDLVNDTSKVAKIDTVRANTSGLKSRIQPIEFSPDDTSKFDRFFSKLDKANTSQVRILHYGDSQIEGDRITGFLRNLFQKKFGGSGPGMLPAIPGNAETSSIMQTASANWIGHSVYYPKDTILPHREFGLLGNFARFTSYHDDTVNRYREAQKAWIEFSPSSMAYSSVYGFTLCKVFYGHVNQLFSVKGFVNDTLIWFEEIDTSQQTRQFQWNFLSPPKKFRIEFEGAKSPDIYGITLDSPTGIAVDNMPFRGSAGTEFVRLNHRQLSEMFHFMPAGLIIYEFGVNVVPYNSKSYKFYQESVARQLRFLKQMIPGANILVIGVSDMSDKSGNYYITKPAVTKVIEAQRQAAFSEGCAFWDLYTAMGGKNSMPSWVFAKPALAQKDFTHFNRTGGHIVAQMLFNAILSEYQKYGDKNLQTNNPVASSEPSSNKN